MKKAPMFIFAVLSLSFSLGALRSQGTQSSKWGFVQVKSCENATPVNDQNANELVGDLVFDNIANDGKAKLKSRSLLSVSGANNEREDKKSADIFNDNREQKWEQEQLLQLSKQQGQTLPDLHKGTQQELRGPDIFNSRSESISPQGQDAATHRIEQWRLINQRRRDRASLTHRQVVQSTSGDPILQRLVGDKQHTQKNSASFGIRDTHRPLSSAEQMENTIEISENNDMQSRQINSKNQPLTRHSSARPNLRSLDTDRGDNVIDLNRRRRKSHGIFLTESTTIYPFIASAQALDYLTSYDLMPLPTRWPIKMIIPDRDQKTPQDQKNSFSNTEHNNARLRQGIPSYLKNSRQHSRSPDQFLQQLSQEGANDNIQVQINREDLDLDDHDNETAQESVDVSTSEVLDAIDPNSSHVSATNMNSGQTQDAKIAFEETDDVKARDHTRRKRMRQKLRKRFKKLRRQRKRRKQKMRETEATTISSITNQVTSTAGYVHVNLADVSNQKPTSGKEDLHSLTIEVEPNEARTIRTSQLFNTKKAPGTSAHSNRDESVTGSLSNEDVSHSYIANTGNYRFMTSTDRINYNNQYRDFDISLKATQPPYKLQEKLASKAKPETKKGHPHQTSNKFYVLAQNEDSDDNQKFFPLKPDVTVAPFFVSDNGKKLSSGENLKTSEENTNGFRDNTGQNIPNRNSPKHVQNHTNFNPDSRQVTTSSWSVTHAIGDNSGGKTEGSYRSAEAFSVACETFSPKTIENTTDVKGNTKHDHETKSRQISSKSDNTVTKMPPSGIQTSGLSSARRWRDKLKQKQHDFHPASKQQSNLKEKSREHSEDNVEGDERRGSLAAAFSKSTSDSTKLSRSETSQSKNGNQEQEENGPFIGYKTAFDFLSNQKIKKTSAHNEVRREANELNRFMGEGMCEIFNKHYVPTRIGGKCE